MQALLDTIAHLPLPSDAQRLFHGRGARHLGSEQWALDWFAPVWLLTSFKPVDEATLDTIHHALLQRWQALCGPQHALNWVFQCRSPEQTETRLMAGSVPQPHNVSEAGAQYRVHLLKGQNHGLFLDMASGRQWVREQVAQHAATKAPNPSFKVLNLFAYTCGFSVAALQAGAKLVVNVDMAAGALATGQINHRLNALDNGASFLPHDIFKTWGKIARSGPYHLVVIDPPSFQKGSFVATKDYAKLIRRLPDLLRPGGKAMLCLNAPELGSAFLRDLVAELAPELQFEQRLANPSIFADIDSERALKVLIYSAPELTPA
ncbi:MAG: class I SAM-dependent methyltransferase [Burkholderiaceae bacterium]|nr:class I SAM-dependent methyltransferase [Burkholderiaceae bacterium]